MEKSRSLGVNSRHIDKKNSHLTHTPKVHYCVHRIQPLDRTRPQFAISPLLVMLNYFTLILTPILGLPCGIFNAGFLTKTAIIFSLPMRTTFPVHLTVFDIVTLTVTQ